MITGEENNLTGFSSDKTEVNAPAIVSTEDDLINQKAKELTTAIAKAESKEELEELYQKFNINNTKKNAVRITQLNDLLDQVNKQAVERFKRRPDEISNKEILDYMTAIQNQIERSQKTVDGIRDINALQVNNTQNNTVNITVGTEHIEHLDKDSRDRITDLIASILKENKQDIVLDTSEGSEMQDTSDAKTEQIIDVDNDDFAGDE